jgi:hypothetical protein
MLAAKQANSGRLIVADPRRTPTVRKGPTFTSSSPPAPMSR